MIIAVTTVGTEKDAKLLAKVAFAEKLAACVQIDEVISIYRWAKEPKEDGEHRLTFKTTKEKLPALEKRMKELHRYELPEWVWWEAQASKEYEDWVNNPKG